MGEYYFTLCYEAGVGSELERELWALYKSGYYPVSIFNGPTIPTIMFEKGLKFIPTIILTAFKIRWLMRSNVRVVYNRLKRKVKVEVKDRCHDTDNYTARRAFWPCEVLDLKEVQDEVGGSHWRSFALKGQARGQEDSGAGH
jgi:hypothetical protein